MRQRGTARLALGLACVLAAGAVQLLVITSTADYYARTARDPPGVALRGTSLGGARPVPGARRHGQRAAVVIPGLTVPTGVGAMPARGGTAEAHASVGAHRRRGTQAPRDVADNAPQAGSDAQWCQAMRRDAGVVPGESWGKDSHTKHAPSRTGRTVAQPRGQSWGTAQANIPTRKMRRAPAPAGRVTFCACHAGHFFGVLSVQSLMSTCARAPSSQARSATQRWTTGKLDGATDSSASQTAWRPRGSINASRSIPGDSWPTDMRESSLSALRQVTTGGLLLSESPGLRNPRRGAGPRVAWWRLSACALLRPASALRACGDVRRAGNMRRYGGNQVRRCDSLRISPGVIN